MANQVRFGILGASRIAKNKHVAAGKVADHCEIVAVASRTHQTAEKFAEEAGLGKAYGSYEAMLEDGEIDAVINTLPNSLHKEWTIKAIKAGKHVLCEKPLAMNGDEARAMFDEAEAAGLVLMEGFIPRFHPQLAEVRQTIDSGEIGEVKMVTAELTYPIGDWSDSRTVAELGGGSLMDAGCYCTNMIRYMMGVEPVRVQGCQVMHEANGVDRAFMGIMEFEGGKLGNMTAGMDEPFRVWCEVTGTKGRVHMSSLFADSLVTTSVMGKEKKVDEFEPGNLFAEEMAHFADCVLNGEKVEIGREESVGNAVTLAGLKKAAEEGRVVEL